MMKVTLIDKKPEIENVFTFVFEPDKKTSWQPGQYLHYDLPHPHEDDRGIGRFFTISAAPFEKHITITTRFDPQKSSTFKLALQKLEIGQQIEAGEPRGEFLIDPDASKHVLIAGGIGITPYRSQLVQMDHDGQDINADLLYANRDENFVFGDLLAGLEEKHPNFQVIKFVGDKRITEADLKKYTDVNDGDTHADGVQGDKGEASDKPGKASLSKSQLTTSGEERTGSYEATDKRVPQPATPQSAASTSGAAGSASRQAGAMLSPVFYLSGPRPMVEAYEHLLIDLDVNPERIKTDYFPGYKLG